MNFLREAEWRIKNNKLSHLQKIDEFFACFKCCKDTKVVPINYNGFLVASEFLKENMENELFIDQFYLVYLYYIKF